MIKFSTGVGPAKLTAAIPLEAAVFASVAAPGAALPSFMTPGVRSDSHTPQALMNVYLGIVNAEIYINRI